MEFFTGSPTSGFDELTRGTQVSVVSEELSHPLLNMLRWLATHTCFPTSRLAANAELLLLVVTAAQVDEAVANAAQPGMFHIKSRDVAKDSALRAHALRRSLVHFKCDNSAKV